MDELHRLKAEGDSAMLLTSLWNVAGAFKIRLSALTDATTRCSAATKRYKPTQLANEILLYSLHLGACAYAASEEFGLKQTGSSRVARISEAYQ